MATNGYVKLDDFLAAITASPVSLEVPGLGTVQVRGLSVMESQELEEYRDNDKQLLVQVVRRGLVSPQLSEEHVDALSNASIAKVRVIAERILELSALGEGEELEKKAGAGS